MSERRTPYVWDGDLVDPAVEIDGCYRSAEIDRTEAETYPIGSQEAARCLASAERWADQARVIERRWWLAAAGVEDRNA